MWSHPPTTDTAVGKPRVAGQSRSVWADLRFSLVYVPICLSPMAIVLLFDTEGVRFLVEVVSLQSVLMLMLTYQLYAKSLDAEARRQELAALVRIDALTGAGNRRALWDTVPREVARARRQGTPVCLLLIDLDRFKDVNDSLGHAAGDRLLQAFAEVVREHTRVSDDQLFRIGGDEFVVLLPGIGCSHAAEVADRLHRTFAVFGPSVVVGAEAGCSVGVAELGLDEEPDRWIHRADRAMYQAKANGGGVVLAGDMGATLESSVIRAVLHAPAVKS